MIFIIIIIIKFSILVKNINLIIIKKKNFFIISIYILFSFFLIFVFISTPTLLRLKFSNEMQPLDNLLNYKFNSLNQDYSNLMIIRFAIFKFKI